MVLDTNISLAIRCSNCGELTVQGFSLFQFRTNENIYFKCHCGQSHITIKKDEHNYFWFKIPCYICERIHTYKYTLKQLLEGNIFIRCVEGPKLCFIGDNISTNEIIKNYKEESSKVLNELKFYDYFSNFDIMMECVNKIRELQNTGNILCDCGEGRIKIDLFEDRIELKCVNCGSIQLIYAENKEDFNRISKINKIIMHKHRFECIDAIKDKNK
ncbi:hypothetical protein [Clostridiisalibacter paucivorans]|uniref:hypothetical protein n=1 Tax=Clostridiisalibacter paucivorans TaxID=408753 RepID=UPI00047DAEFD|nr:hypothetical protein [Clostridiisalibacter paucivorans]